MRIVKMNATVSSKQDALLINGHLDFTTVPLIWQQSVPLLTRDTIHVIDFSDVKSSSSAALALILEYIRYAENHQKTYQLKGISQKLLTIAKAAGIEAILKKYM